MTPISAQESVRRLTVLANFLGQVNNDLFRMNSWGIAYPESSETVLAEELSATDMNNPTCNTTACALGWAAVIPEFKELGLSLRLESHGCDEAHYGVYFLDKTAGPHEVYMGEDEVAARNFFNLTADQASYLFMPRDAQVDSLFDIDWDMIPKEFVINRIHEVIKMIETGDRPAHMSSGGRDRCFAGDDVAVPLEY